MCLDVLVNVDFGFIFLVIFLFVNLMVIMVLLISMFIIRIKLNKINMFKVIFINLRINILVRNEFGIVKLINIVGCILSVVIIIIIIKIIVVMMLFFKLLSILLMCLDLFCKYVIVMEFG